MSDRLPEMIFLHQYLTEQNTSSLDSLPKGRLGRNPGSSRRCSPYPLLLPSPPPVSAAGQSSGSVGGGGAFSGRGAWSHGTARAVAAARVRDARRGPAAAGSAACPGGVDPTAAGCAACPGGGKLGSASRGWRRARGAARSARAARLLEGLRRVWSAGRRPRLVVDELVPWSWPAGSGFASSGAVVFGHRACLSCGLPW